jgi:hypothetical protein
LARKCSHYKETSANRTQHDNTELDKLTVSM